MKETIEILENMNPIRRRYVQWFNSLSEEQQIAMKGIDNLSKEEFYLKKIKRKRKPNIVPGTIFAMHLPENVYLYGKVIQEAENFPMIDPGFFIIMLSNIVTKELENVEFKINESTILAGPMIIGDGLWRNGTSFTTGYYELTEDEKTLDIGFMKMHGANNYYLLDKHGGTTDREAKFLDYCAYTTIYGIEYEIRKQVILGNIKTGSRYPE